MVAVVDANGPPLAAALAAEPDFVTPNIAEAEKLLLGRADEMVEAGDPAEVRQRAVAAAMGLSRRGTHSDRRHGRRGRRRACRRVASRNGHPARRVEVRNPIGAGDALVGGLCVALERGESPGDAVTSGLATAAASVETAKAGAIDPGRARSSARAAEVSAS